MEGVTVNYTISTIRVDGAVVALVDLPAVYSQYLAQASGQPSFLDYEPDLLNPAV